jgi:hypothetical protein
MASKISLLPTALDLELYAGDGVALRLAVTDTSQQPMQLTGEITAQIRKARTDADSAADWAADLADGDNGIVIISLTGDQTAALMNGSDKFTGVWDVQWQATDAEPVTLIQGAVSCQSDVTRP